MKELSYNNIYSLLRKSKSSIIGYSYRSEKDKDDLISKLNFIEYNPQDPILSIVRNNKIDNILDINSNLNKYILLDIQSYPLIRNNYQVKINNLINQLKDTDYNLVITSLINKKLSITHDYLSFPSSELTYSCDLAITIDNNITIIKNRLYPMYYGSINLE